MEQLRRLAIISKPRLFLTEDDFKCRIYTRLNAIVFFPLR